MAKSWHLAILQNRNPAKSRPKKCRFESVLKFGCADRLKERA
jgi:hypothetical protein